MRTPRRTSNMSEDPRQGATRSALESTTLRPAALSMLQTPVVATTIERGRKRQRHPVAQCEGDVELWSPNGSGGFTYQDLGVVGYELADRRNRRFHRQAAKTASCGATRRPAGSSSGTRTARGASRYDSLGVVNTSWQIEGTGDFTGERRRRHLVAQHIDWRRRALEPERLGRLRLRQDLGAVNSSWQIDGTGDFNGERRRRHPVAQCERRCRALEPEWLGGLHLPKPGRCRAPAGRSRNRRFHRQAAKTASCGAMRRLAASSSGTRTARGASPIKAWASSTPAWQIAATGDFAGDGADSILWRNASTGAGGALEPERLGGLRVTKTWASSAPAGQIFRPRAEHGRPDGVAPRLRPSSAPDSPATKRGWRRRRRSLRR